MKNAYYQKVKTYYDQDATDFDSRYWENPVLQRIRQSFREEVKRFRFKNILEVGFGTGIDILHFASTHPEANIFGIDISEEMYNIAAGKIAKNDVKNVSLAVGSVENMDMLFTDNKFDLIYVFFGALNTVENIREASLSMQKMLNENGVLVLTFVNKYYLTGIILELLKLRFSRAFSRIGKTWGGYSPVKYLPSRCYSPNEICRAFRELDVLKRKGYSIIHPAWYYTGLNQKLKRIRRVLWKVDEIVNKTFLWKFGEYTLFVFKKS